MFIAREKELRVLEDTFKKDGFSKITALSAVEAQPEVVVLPA